MSYLWPWLITWTKCSFLPHLRCFSSCRSHSSGMSLSGITVIAVAGLPTLFWWFLKSCEEAMFASTVVFFFFWLVFWMVWFMLVVMNSAWVQTIFIMSGIICSGHYSLLLVLSIMATLLSLTLKLQASSSTVVKIKSFFSAFYQRSDNMHPCIISAWIALFTLLNW